MTEIAALYYCERPSCQQGKPTARTFRLREASVDDEYGLSPMLGHERFRASPLRGRFSINEIDGGRGRVIVGDGRTHHVAGEVVNRSNIPIYAYTNHGAVIGVSRRF